MDKAAQRLHALGIVRPVDEDIAAPFQPGGPPGSGHALAHGLVGDIIALIPQGFHHAQHGQCVGQLMLPGQGDGHVFPGVFQSEGRLGTAFAALAAEDHVAPHLAQRRMDRLRCSGEHRGHIILRRMAYHRYAGLDDAGLLRRDGGQRVPQEGHVIQPDGSNGAHAGADKVGGIQPAAHAHLHNGEVHPLPLEHGGSQSRA